jgi:hemoglobin-like flavoprotein
MYIKINSYIFTWIDHNFQEKVSSNIVRRIADEHCSQNISNDSSNMVCTKLLNERQDNLKLFCSYLPSRVFLFNQNKAYADRFH